MSPLIAGILGDAGSLCSMVIFAMILACVLAHKLTPAKTQGQIAASGLEAFIRKLFGGK